MFSTTYSLSKDPNICFLIDWNVISSLLSMKVAFKTIVCICDQKSFSNLVVTFEEEDFMDNISMEYGFTKLPSKKFFYQGHQTCGWNCHFWYMFFFASQEGKSTQADYLASMCVLHGSPSMTIHFWKSRGCTN